MRILIPIIIVVLHFSQFCQSTEEIDLLLEGPPENILSNDYFAENENSNGNETSDGEKKVKNEKEYQERMQIMEEWENQMSDFIPDAMLTFEIEKGQTEIFVENIEIKTSIRGAYFISYMSQDKINFQIIGPSGKILLDKQKKRESLFILNTTEYGEYKFVFNNKFGKDSKQITFALDVKNNTEDKLSHTDLSPIELAAEKLNQHLLEAFSETKFSTKRTETYYSYIEDTHKRLLMLSAFETIAIFAATCWQVYYIKNMLDSKRIV